MITNAPGWIQICFAILNDFSYHILFLEKKEIWRQKMKRFFDSIQINNSSRKQLFGMVQWDSFHNSESFDFLINHIILFNYLDN